MPHRKPDPGSLPLSCSRLPADDHYTWISTTQQLEAAIPAMKQASFLALDTEFMRTTTYWPMLCLVQIACGHEDASQEAGGVFIIDATSAQIDLTPLREIILSANLTKVFHAGRQDLEIFYHLFGELPPLASVFDTQIAAMACLDVDFPSYDRLCKMILNVDLDKTFQRTNWSRRPLQGAEIRYAVRDVTYLRLIYKYLKKVLSESGRIDWPKEEMEVLLSKKTYAFDVHHAIEKVHPRKRKNLGLLYELLQWRESEAQKKNLSRERIVSSSVLVDLSVSPPSSLADVKRWVNKPTLAEAIFEIIQRCRSKNAMAGKKEWVYNSSSNAITDDKLQLAMLRILAHMVCKKHKVSQHLLLSNHINLKYLIRKPLPLGDDEESVRLKKDWRWNIFGRLASEFINGKVFLGFEKKNGHYVLKKEGEVVEYEHTHDQPA